MKIDEINTIRLALDTPEHNRHYIKHTTDAKLILNRLEDEVRKGQTLPIDSVVVPRGTLVCDRCTKPTILSKNKQWILCTDCGYRLKAN